MSDNVQNEAAQITSQYDLKLTDPELDELVEHFVAFRRRAETIRRVGIDQSEEPALKLFVESLGGSR